MVKPVSVVHYVNQFFGGIGGEEKANSPVQVRDGPVGPGRALQQLLGSEGTVVATIVAGDNHVVEEKETALAAVRETLKRYKPSVVVAGPAFEAGRYGLACAEICREAQAQGIPAVTGMYPDNPGVIAYRQELFCVPTGANTSEMQAVLRKMASLALKLGRGQALGTAAEEGYLPRGLRKPIMRDTTGAQRAADMLRAAMDGKSVATEVWVREFDLVPPAPPLGDPTKATIALITTGACATRSRSMSVGMCTLIR